MEVKYNRGRGRPPKPEEEKAITTAVSLPPELALFARELGAGNISHGVQIALAETRKRSKPKKGKPAPGKPGRARGKLKVQP